MSVVGKYSTNDKVLFGSALYLYYNLNFHRIKVLFDFFIEYEILFSLYFTMFCLVQYTFKMAGVVLKLLFKLVHL